jgi:hypothetical protein
MTIGAALLLLAVGAILRFAVATVATHGIDLHTIGDILMVVGVLGLFLSMLFWAPWSRGRSAGYDRRGSANGQRSGYPPPPPSYRAPMREASEDDYDTETYRR